MVKQNKIFFFSAEKNLPEVSSLFQSPGSNSEEQNPDFQLH